MTQRPPLAEIVTEAWLRQITSRLHGAEAATKPEWDALTLTVGGKLFAMHGENNLGQAILTVKGDPLENEALRQEFSDIVPGYYANKKHWISILLDTATLGEDRVSEMLQGSYELVFGGLSKKLQAQLRAEHSEHETSKTMSEAPSALSFNFIGIVTNNLSASLAFYRLLGLDIAEGQDDEAHVEHKLAGGMVIAWDPLSTIHSFDPEFQLPQGVGRVSFACQAETPADVDRAYRRITEAGYEGRTAPWDAPWGQRYATVLDPDGNAVDLYAALGSVSNGAEL